MIKQTYPVIGIHCASCKILIEKMVGKVDGVNSVLVNFATEKMTVEFDDSETNLEEIKSAVAKAGSYKLITGEGGEVLLASPTAQHNHKMHDHATLLKRKAYEALQRRVLWVGIGVIPFALIMLRMLLGMLGMVQMDMAPLGTITLDSAGYSINLFFLLQFLLATPILFIGGRQFFESAWSALKAKTANMDTLVALGTFTAWLFSTFVTFVPKLFGDIEVDVFFEAAVFIVFFILLGRLLEARAKGQANSAIKKLLEMQAKEATVIRGGKEVSIPIEQLTQGDLIRVRPGEKVPVDGEIIEGVSTIDESMVTGESMPIVKNEGDKVIGATINRSGSFVFKAEKIGRDTLLSQIIKMVEEAQASTSPVQKLADQISGVFVPVVIAIAIFVFAFWLVIAPALGMIDQDASLQFATFVATSVLIIACPCALGLATPTAIMVGTGKAARNGILIKDAQALELAYKTKIIVFDKTGTLTKGQPEVTDFVALKDFRESEIFKLANAVESLSEHPLSNAIQEFTDSEKDESIKSSGFKNIEGKGVQASIDGRLITIGNPRLMNDEGVTTSEVDEQVKKLAEAGKTVVIMAIDNVPAAIFALADTIKESSAGLINKLHQLGIRVVMLTGDNQSTADAIALELNIDEVIAGVLPSDKVNKIKSLQSENPGMIVAMVGDGVNDAPALAQADIGIAMGTGTDVAIETGDIVLVHGTLDKVIESIAVSRLTLNVIRQNLFWAFGYNLVAIPVAAGLLYPITGLLLSPVLASGAMALSSISVVLNSIRIKRD